ncbi:hypothetical protein CAOG_06976 [Capsaspora owczarzaki ATCC 30864]|uniref:Required for respiratory growth protein 9, mitochondrial n=1 Tax=Capsaspora owczarzaki (strain ATCC 30864) TaxID=595528 RepID=A0A0D2VYB5_CAPO3|nr:hypothetical protein CAOG_06976 [Capsaspora owczarzaki ATCC 30864]KJE96697.1 hypothetical protein CAOG_006976 [Capsaspora owczarzaki ATCC 30864]|eukprot:XP_004343700.2 hypothetical protein CAOG_06976 [Capsaspora owczarzaki ATCC 30864]
MPVKPAGRGSGKAPRRPGLHATDNRSSSFRAKNHEVDEQDRRPHHDRRPDHKNYSSNTSSLQSRPRRQFEHRAGLDGSAASLPNLGRSSESVRGQTSSSSSSSSSSGGNSSFSSRKTPAYDRPTRKGEFDSASFERKLGAMRVDDRWRTSSPPLNGDGATPSRDGPVRASRRERVDRNVQQFISGKGAFAERIKAAQEADPEFAETIESEQRAFKARAHALRRRELFREQGVGPWAPQKKLSYMQMQEMRELFAEDAAVYNVYKLSNMFHVSQEAVRRIIHSKFQPSAAKFAKRDQSIAAERAKAEKTLLSPSQLSKLKGPSAPRRQDEPDTTQ